VDSTATGVPRATWRDIPASIWALGLVSLLMDLSSETIHSLLPVFLVSSLGAGTLAVGIIEGVAEATASITKVFSGTLSDYLGKRKALTVVGYGVAALTKPLFPLAPSLGWVVTARFVDRIGKGIRGAPRDALVADLSAPHVRGAAFGLRQSLDTVGAFAGPVVAIALMLATGDDFRTVFWVAVVPAFAAVALLVVGVTEPDSPRPAGAARSPIRLDTLRSLGLAYWGVVAVATTFTLARFSEAFLVLRARDAGLGLAWVPLVLVLMNVVYAGAAYPLGALSDRVARHHLLAGGFVVLIVADLVLAHGSGLIAVMAGVALWGLHMGMTQGVLSAMVADTAPAVLRGTAFGVLNLVTGVAMLPASVVAGALWDRVGPAATFDVGAAVTALALVGLLLIVARRPT
jgi:MFS family permease